MRSRQTTKDRILFFIKDVFYDKKLLKLIFLYSGESNILVINKIINYEVKIYFVYYKLNKIFSKKFYEDNHFRSTMICERVNDPKTQLEVSLPMEWCSVTNDNLKALNNLYHLDLTGNNEICEVNRLKDCHSLNLSRCTKVVNVNKLDKLFSLNLSYCSNISDVSMLGNIHKLILKGCRGISDFSQLGSVHYLDLSSTNIRNTGGLGNVDTLILANCEKLCDISSLGKNKSLHLGYNNNIVDVSHLNDVERLCLFQLPNLVDVSRLGNIPRLSIFECQSIIEVNGLGNVKNLSLVNLPSLRCIKSLGNHDFLMISSCHLITIKTVKHLTIVRKRLLLGREFKGHEDEDYLRQNMKALHIMLYDSDDE